MDKDHNIEISIYITDDIEIKKMNAKYRGKNEATDVLSFLQDNNILGDIVISIDTTIRQAILKGIKFEIELYELIIHGALHLFGYDHEKNKNNEKKMLMLQNKIINLFFDKKNVE